mmetsp:Transcript_27527/g.63648  ORF Transcript_27527/g.63648 Transcript_27527/m.63648 type:complete len:200 (-) Transcript_27527:1081-1680(-)
MDIVLQRFWDVIVDNIHAVLDVQAPLSHISGNQNIDLAVAKLMQGPVTLTLILVAMDSSSCELSILQLSTKSICSSLCFCKDKHLVASARYLLHLCHKPLLLLVINHNLNDLLDVWVETELLRSDCHLDRIFAAEVPGQTLDFLWPCCRPHQGLSIWPNLRHNLANLRLEAHVQHAVCLIQDQVCHPFEVRLASLKEVQ